MVAVQEATQSTIPKPPQSISRLFNSGAIADTEIVKFFAWLDSVIKEERASAEEQRSLEYTIGQFFSNGRVAELAARVRTESPFYASSLEENQEKKLEASDKNSEPKQQRTNNANFVDSKGKFIWKDGEIVFNFGHRHKGKPLKLVIEEDKSYLTWMLTNDFPNDTKELVSNALKGKFPEPTKKTDA